MTALEPGQHDPLDGLHRYEVRPFALRDMPWDDVMDRDDDYGPFVKYADLPALIARVVERERGKALADRDREWVEALAAVEMYSVEGYAEVWRQLLGPALAQFAEPHVSEFLSWAASLAAAAPAEGTPE